MKDKIFWEAGFNGNAVGGFFIRNNLFKFFEKLKENGLHPVGIRVEDGWNLEVIVEKNEAYNNNYKEKNENHNS